MRDQEYVIRMVTVDKAVIARLQKSGKTFEVLVDPELAYEFKTGRSVSVSKLLATNQIFSDSKKGLRASEKDIENVFHTLDIENVAKRIIKEGDIQLTTEFRRKRKEEKEKQIANFISRHGLDPRTKNPHPPERILTAMEKVHVNVDPFKPAEQQVDDVIKSIKAILPVSFENVKLTIEILPQFSGKAYSILKEFTKTGDEQWLSDGTLRAKIEIPASLKDSLYRKLNAATGGTVRITES